MPALASVVAPPEYHETCGSPGEVYRLPMIDLLYSLIFFKDPLGLNGFSLLPGQVNGELRCERYENMEKR